MTPIDPGMYVEKVAGEARAIECTASSTTAFVDFFACGPVDRAILTCSFRAFEREFGGLDLRSESSFAILQFFLNGGRRAWVVRVVSPDSESMPGSESWKISAGADAILGQAEAGSISGLNLLQNLNREGFQILCLPAIATLDEHSFKRVALEAIRFCKAQKAFFIMDPPAGINAVTDIIQWLEDNDSLCSDHVALYFPRIIIKNPLDQNRPRITCSSGTMAGIYSHTDRYRGVWKAPAGMHAALTGATLTMQLTDSDNSALNSCGICALRQFSISDPIVWGSRTLKGADYLASEWKYIAVRRLGLVIEKSLSQGLEWVVFEQNDNVLWANIRLRVGSFMDGIFRQGALLGSTSREAFFVKCDAETTTESDIRSGIVNVLVGFAPVKPAEFIILRLQVNAGQSGSGQE